MIEVREVAKTYTGATGATVALHPVSATAAAGDFLVISGPSGSGKSTLLGIFGLLIRPSAGHVLFDGADVTNSSEDNWDRQRRVHVGLIPQHPRLLADLTARQNVQLALDRRGTDAAIDLVLERVGLAGRRDHRAGSLSGGEAQRLSLARAVVKEPRVIVADEPTSGLDDANATTVLELLAALAREGTAIVVATHDARAHTYGTSRLDLAKENQR